MFDADDFWEFIPGFLVGLAAGAAFVGLPILVVVGAVAGNLGAAYVVAAIAVVLVAIYSGYAAVNDRWPYR